MQWSAHKLRHRGRIVAFMRRKSTTSGMMMDYIAQALLQLMETAPFAAITVQQIAARAGVNRSTYYRHFSGKEDVLLHYLDQLMTRYEAALPQRSLPVCSPIWKRSLRFSISTKPSCSRSMTGGQILLFLQVLNRTCARSRIWNMRTCWRNAAPRTTSAVFLTTTCSGSSGVCRTARRIWPRLRRASCRRALRRFLLR